MASYGKRSIAGCPPYAQETALELVRLGFPENTWRFLEEVTVPDRNHRLQIRNDKDLAPAADINLYAENMRQGDQFPPMIVTGDEVPWLLDGNTRGEAVIKITPKGRTPVFPAFVLDATLEDATQATRDRFKVLQVAFNNKHGNKMSQADTEAAIRTLMHEGMSQNDMARLLHVHPHTVKAVQNAHRAAERLRSLNVDVTGLSRTQLEQIQVKAGGMMDAPFKELGEVASLSNMTGPETVDLIKELNDLKSESAQLRVLSGVREQRGPEITGMARSSSLANAANRNWGFFLKYSDTPTILAQTGTRAARELFVKRGWEAVAIQQKLLDAMEDELKKG